jgi:Taurine catabolism dioxygenase TauD, TfdA family
MPWRVDNDVPPALWPTTSALLAASRGDLEVAYDDFATPRGLLRAITQLQRTGLLFFRDVPFTNTSDSGCEVRKLAARFAEIRETFYGAVWNVKNAVDSRNIAYTNLFLGLYMDLQYVPSLRSALSTHSSFPTHPRPHPHGDIERPMLNGTYFPPHVGTSSRHRASRSCTASATACKAAPHSSDHSLRHLHLQDAVRGAATTRRDPTTRPRAVSC